MNKILKTSMLALLILAAGLSSCFAAHTVPVTAVATVAPAGEYAPVITVADQVVREGVTLEFEVLAADANPADTAVIQITQGQAAWMSIVSNVDGNPARMTVRLAPGTGTAGRYRLYFEATDNSSYTLTGNKDIYVTVGPANNAPSITADNQAVQAGQVLNFIISSSDPDTGDMVTLTYSGKPSWLNASLTSPVTGNPAGVTFNGTPQASDEGTYTLTFNVSDNGTPVQSASKQITIIVSRENHPPVLDPIRDKESPIRVKLEFAINATDPDGDTLTYSATGTPFSSGATFDTATRTFSWTPTASQAGTYPVHFTVLDNSLSDFEDINIIISANEAPVFDPLFDQTIRVDKTLCFAVVARDPNNDPILYAAPVLPTGASFDALAHTFTWVPQSGQEGWHNAEFTASDTVHTTTKVLHIYVNYAPAPELEPVDVKYARAGQALSFRLNASDPNGLPLTYSVSGLPAGYTLTGPEFSWMPLQSQINIYKDVVFTVSNGTYSDSKPTWIYVQSNDAPVIERIAEPYIGKHIVAGRTLSFTVKATDPNGDPLTYSASNLPVGAVFDSVSHTFTWTPATGEDRVYKDVIFNVSDGINTTSENVWIFVDANDAPVVEGLADQYGKPGDLISFGISAYDPNGDALTYRALNLPDGAIFSDRTFRWTPAAAQIGTYRNITFEVSDGTNTVIEETTIFVTASGAPVIYVPGEMYVGHRVKAGDNLQFVVSATDPDTSLSNLTFSVANLPPGATFTDNHNGTATFNWTPTSAQVGTYPQVAFTVNDGAYTDMDSTWIFVIASGAPTIYVPGELYAGHQVRTGDNLQFVVSATDPDTSLSNLTFSVANLPPGATFTDNHNGTASFNWTPTSAQVGTYPQVAFTVSDGAYTDMDSTWIFVIASGTPQFTQDVPDIYGRVGEPIIFNVSATDPDAQVLTYEAINLPPGATFTGQTFRWTPQAGQTGTYPNVRIEVRDTDNNIAADTFWIFIAPNTPPTLDFIGTKYGTVGQLLMFTISATDPDPNTTLTYSVSNLPSGAVFDPATRRFSWMPSAADTYTGIHFGVSDGIETDSEDISIVVSP